MNLIKSFTIRLNSFGKCHFKALPVTSCRGLTSDTEDKYLVDREAVINERSFADLDVQQFASLAANNSQMKDIENILNNYEYVKYTTCEVPTSLSHQQMKHLLQMPTTNERLKYFRHLYRTEIKVIVNKKRNKLKSVATQEKLQGKYSQLNSGRGGIFGNDGQIVYGLWHNSLFTRISRQNCNRLANHRLRTASLFGQKLIVDMSVPTDINRTNCNANISQLIRTYHRNRKLLEPFDLIFSDIDYNGLVWKALEERGEELSNLPYFLSNFTDKSYIDSFYSKSLVYLTPNATKVLTEYDANKVYIIGFMDAFYTNNKQKQMFEREFEPKADIETRRLPIDEHVFWRSGKTKDLKAYIVLKILSDVKHGMDWRTAIETNVPKQFIKPQELVDRENELRSHRYLAQKLRLKLETKQLFDEQ